MLLGSHACPARRQSMAQRFLTPVASVHVVLPHTTYCATVSQWGVWRGIFLGLFWYTHNVSYYRDDQLDGLSKMLMLMPVLVCSFQASCSPPRSRPSSSSDTSSITKSPALTSVWLHERLTNEGGSVVRRCLIYAKLCANE